MSILAEENLSQRQLADRCGINPTTVHAVIHGRPCSQENLRLFCTHISANVRWKYEVLIAHLRDEVTRSGLDPSPIVVRYVDGLASGAVALPEEVSVSIGILAREAQTDPALQKLLDSLASMTVRAKAVVADAIASRAQHVPPKASAGQRLSIFAIANAKTPSVAHHIATRARVSRCKSCSRRISAKGSRMIPP